MSQPRFAAITAGLLARKGEARPWAEPDKQPLAWRSAEASLSAPQPEPEAVRQTAPQRTPLVPQPELQPIRQTAPTPPPPAPLPEPHAEPSVTPRAEPRSEWKKYVLRISHHDYERLGILAVKQGKTRQRLLQETVDHLFTGMKQAYGANCACLGEKRL